MAAPSGESVGVAASARIQTVRWGTRIDLSCHQIAGGAVRRKCAVSTGGRGSQWKHAELGTWNLPTRA